MTKRLTMKQTGLAVSCALALGAVSSMVRAETFPAPNTDPADTNYLSDQRGAVVTSNYGLCWHTGTGSAVASSQCDPITAPAAPTAQVVAPAPPPMAVAAVAAPAPKQVERITLDADTLFDFDKAVLRPAGRVALDDFFVKIKGIAPETIMAVGHTDRIGSDKYNQNLSEQRVAAVKTYLVGKGIEPNRLHTEGMGETQPVTKADECPGRKSAKVIACLQPDRRVDIEVVGNKIDQNLASHP